MQIQHCVQVTPLGCGGGSGASRHTRPHQRDESWCSGLRTRNRHESPSCAAYRRSSPGAGASPGTISRTSRHDHRRHARCGVREGAAGSVGAPNAAPASVSGPSAPRRWRTRWCRVPAGRWRVLLVVEQHLHALNDPQCSPAGSSWTSPTCGGGRGAPRGRCHRPNGPGRRNVRAGAGAPGALASDGRVPAARGGCTAASTGPTGTVPRQPCRRIWRWTTVDGDGARASTERGRARTRRARRAAVSCPARPRRRERGSGHRARARARR